MDKTVKQILSMFVILVVVTVVLGATFGFKAYKSTQEENALRAIRKLEEKLTSLQQKEENLQQGVNELAK